MTRYKNDKLRIEDALIPALLVELMTQHIEQQPEKDPSSLDKYFALLRPEITKEINNEKLRGRLIRAKNKIFDWLVKQEWGIPKAYMVVSRMDYQLYNEGKVDFSNNAIEALQDLNNEIEKYVHEDKIRKQDESALKQAPKLLKIIQQQGYYI